MGLTNHQPSPANLAGAVQGLAAVGWGLAAVGRDLAAVEPGQVFGRLGKDPLG